MQKTLGFRLYMNTAEKYRQQFAEKAEIFTQLLPYAIVFGCVSRWARAFEGIDTSASNTWYVGNAPFQAAVLSSSLESMNANISSAIASSPPSSGSSSPFGGGGSSGGGGGGGGGGSWSADRPRPRRPWLVRGRDRAVRCRRRRDPRAAAAERAPARGSLAADGTSRLRLDAHGPLAGRRPVGRALQRRVLPRVGGLA